jgi:hypothetical protein
MKRLLGVFVMALFCAMVAPSLAQQVPQGTQNVVFPPSMGGLQLRGVVWYASPGLGYSVRYAVDGAIVDVYVYNNTNGPVPEGMQSEQVVNEMRNSHRAALEGYRVRNEQVQVTREGQALVTGEGNGRWQWLAAEYAVQLPNGTRAGSFMLLAGHMQQFIKVRGSFRTDVPNPPSLRAFANELSALIATSPQTTNQPTPSGSKGI